MWILSPKSQPERSRSRETATMPGRMGVPRAVPDLVPGPPFSRGEGV